MALPKRLAPERPAEPEAMKPTTGATVTVREFRFAGNTLLASDRLAPVVAPYLDRPLGFVQLQAAAAAVAEAYREAGWVVRAYLPAQDIKDGIVTIQIIEAVFGGLYKEGPDPARIGTAQVLEILSAQQKAGEPLNNDALDRALLLADDLPGVAVSGALREGTGSGETDLVVKMADEPLTVGEANLDNTGSRSTGKNRLSANLTLNSPVGYGESFTANTIHTAGSDYLRLATTFPVGSNGWRIGANTSHMRYKLVAPEFVTLDAKGTSDTIGLEASYPIVRSRLSNLFLAITADHKTFDNEFSGAVTTRYRADTLSIALNGNLFDNLGGGGANSASLIWVDGKLNLDGSPNQATDATTTRAAGKFSKLRWSLSRQQVITNDLSLFAQFAGQLAGKNLDSSEKFYLGGASGVRAYPSNEGGGSEGEMLNLELRWKLPEGFTLTGFHDWGHVTVNRNNSYTGAANPNGISLKGHGLSLAWATPSGVSLKAVWARREGHNPNPTTTDNDQDGSLLKNRVWLTASLPF